MDAANSESQLTPTQKNQLLELLKEYVADLFSSARKEIEDQKREVGRKD